MNNIYDDETCEYMGKCMQVCDCDKCKVRFQKDKFEIKMLVILVVIACSFAIGMTVLTAIL